MFLHITQAEYLGDYRLKLFFNNGAIGHVDLEAELYGEVFEPLLDGDLFQQFSITSRTIEWPNGADFAPEFLYDIANLIQEPNKSLVTNHYSPATTH
ncbi:MAG: DUF2442 domain-containing protein [Chloroflexi bacterium]|nr:DUF2442 domain-containing protein [Chloroflexota bacterium]